MSDVEKEYDADFLKNHGDKELLTKLKERSYYHFEQFKNGTHYLWDQALASIGDGVLTMTPEELALHTDYVMLHMHEEEEPEVWLAFCNYQFNTKVFDLMRTEDLNEDIFTGMAYMAIYGAPTKKQERLAYLEHRLQEVRDS